MNTTHPAAGRILIVGHDPDGGPGTERLLETAGHIVCRAASGAAARRSVCDQRPDLVLLPYDRTGLEVCRQIKHDPALADILVVVVSAAPGPSDEPAAALEAGADGCIRRPVTNRELLAQVASYLRRADLTRSLRRQAEERQQNLAAALAANAALSTNESRLRFAFEGSGDGLWDWNVSAGTVFFSKRWKEMLGYAEDEIGHGLEEWSKRVHPDDRAETLAAVRAYLAGKTPQYTKEHRVQCKDGSWKWILDRGLVVERDAAGSPVRMLGTHKDITARRQAEQALRESEAKFRLLAENIQDVFWLTTPSLEQLLYVSPAFEKIWGRDCASLYQSPRSFLQAIRPSGQGLPGTTSPTPARDNWEVEYQIVRPDGTRRWILERGFPIRDPQGVVTFICGVATDITAPKQNEIELRASQLQLSNLAHRLQTVREEEATRIAREIHDELGQQLTGLKMDLRGLERGLERPHDPSTSALLEKTVTATELVDVIICTVQRIAAELRPAILDKLGLTPALRRETSLFEQKTGIACRLTVPEVELRTSPLLAIACFRIFQEALTNVARHAAATQVEVELQTQPGGFKLEIRDNGQGLPPAVATTSQSLGLLGMRERAQALGGTVTVTARAAGGTVVSLWLPVKPEN